MIIVATKSIMLWLDSCALLERFQNSAFVHILITHVKNTPCHFVELRRSLWRAYSLGHVKKDSYVPFILRVLLLLSFYTVYSRARSKAFRLKKCSFVPLLWYLISLRKTNIPTKFIQQITSH